MKNNFKTVLLLGLLTGVLVGVGGLIGGRGGATFGLMMALVMNMGSYWFSDKIALRMSRAVEVSEADAPELYGTVRNLATSAGLPMPSVHVIPSAQPNAFATGRNPKHAAVAVTQGLMETLSRDELEGVVAHELAHVKNRDILTASIAATIAGAISWLAYMAQWGAMFGGSDDDDSSMGFVGILLAAIVTPLAAMVIQMAISRSREYEADRDGAEICGRPLSLASALRKIDILASQRPMNVNPSSAPMYIVNPLRGKFARGLAGLFSTHPPTEERVRRLERLGVGV